MNNRCRLLLPFLPLAALPLTACNGPECETNFDCGAYMQCTDDGVCIGGDRPDVVAGGNRGGFRGDGGDGEFVDADVPFDSLGYGVEGGGARFVGNIGPSRGFDSAMLFGASAFDRALSLSFTRPGATSTFVYLTFDDASFLDTPGSYVVGGNGSAGYIQACNYDGGASYDEQLPEVSVDVAPPDPATPDAPPEVTITFPEAGGGTTGTATVRLRITG